LGESTMTYASVTSGFKSGGWSSDDFGVVDEETVITYELGVKSTLTESLRANLTFFYNDYEDLQVNGTNPTTRTFTRLNAGDVITWGVEADINWQPIESLQIDAFVGTLEGEYDSIRPEAAALITSR